MFTVGTIVTIITATGEVREGRVVGYTQNRMIRVRDNETGSILIGSPDKVYQVENREVF